MPLNSFKLQSMPLIEIFFFFLSIVIIGLTPFFLLYGLSNVIQFFLYRVFRYRKKVVFQNLEGSFPLMTRNDLQRTTSLFYKNLTDVFLESIKAFTMGRKQIIKQHRITNPEVLEPFYKTGQCIIGVTGHYCNWEWGSLSASLQSKYPVVAFYKPLQNKLIDRFVRWSRSRFGTTLVPIGQTSLAFKKHRFQTIFLMAADQGMPHKFKDKAIWVQFLNRETAFLYGLEKHARSNNIPVIYVDVQRVKRGYYTVELSVLTTNPIELPEGKLTEIYARKLESIILKKPENWLWSHRRWKLSR